MSRLAEMSARIDSARNASLVRRPVFDRELQVVAYEVVLGGGPAADITVEQGDGFSRVVANSVVEIDCAEIGDGKPVHLPVCSAALGSVVGIDPAQVMLVLGSRADASAETVAALGELRSAGFRIVLDDLAANPQLHPLLPLADAVKVDIGLAAGPSFARQIAVLRASGVELVADRVGSYEELRDATRVGFSQFQGPFLCRPDGFRKEQVSAGQVATMELIALLQAEEAEISDIADVIRRDVSLSYRVLKVANSAQYSLPRPLTSIEEAVMLVGTKQIVSWVGMMCMSRLTGKPSELTRTAMVRARVCECIAGHLGRSDVRSFHLVGLFSVVEALLDVPARQVLGDLPLSSEIVDAIASQNGIMGEVLRGVVAYEDADWVHAHIIGIDDDELNKAYHIARLETDRDWAQVAD